MKVTHSALILLAALLGYAPPASASPWTDFRDAAVRIVKAPVTHVILGPTILATTAVPETVKGVKTGKLELNKAAPALQVVEAGLDAVSKEIEKCPDLAEVLDKVGPVSVTTDGDGNTTVTAGANDPATHHREQTRNESHVQANEGREWGVSVPADDKREGDRELLLSLPLRPAVVGDEFGVPRAGGPHKGVDFPVPVGTPVFASAGGKVLEAGDSNGASGVFVKIEHEFGVETQYLHLSSVEVGMGETVERGQIVGRSGNTGRSSGPHLHWHVKKHGEAVDGMRTTIPSRSTTTEKHAPAIGEGASQGDPSESVGEPPKKGSPS